MSYEHKSWFVQIFYRVVRTLYIGWLFTPLTLVSLLVLFSESITLREYWLGLLVKTLEQAGCTFQKYAQICSMRPDMFAADVIEALSTLRYNI